MRVWVASLLAVTVLLPGAGQARSGDVMPPPQKAPRIAVAKEPIKTINAQPMEYEGKASALDGERILVGGKEVRLFGIVTPALSSNYGPQAKAKLEQLVQGKDVLCKVTNRDKDGNPIAFCGTVNTPDISYEMLRQGWAMADAKALKNNSLAEVYGHVEQEAQAQNKGLFAPAQMTVSIPVSNPSRAVVLPSPSAPIALEGGEKLKAQDAEPAPVAAAPAPAEARAESQPPKEEPAPKVGDRAPDELIAATVLENASRRSGGRSFVERYQQMLSALVWLLAAAGFGGALIWRDRLRLKDKRRMLAAALQGEMTALRQICRARARELSRQRRIVDAEAQPRPSQLWPRLRMAVYQAQAGSIGLLGSELSRQVSRIYGQCADYAVLAQGAAAQQQARQPSVQAVCESLSAMADDIEYAIEALAQVESSGEPYVAELPADEEYAVPLPESSVANVGDAEESRKKMEKATEVLAGLFRSRQGKAGEAEGAASEPAPKTNPQKADGQQAA